MTRQEYIQIVQNNLSGMDPKDVSDALIYLNEYFDEGGNEEEVIEELGSPEKYAAIIRADFMVQVPPRIPSQALQKKPASVWKTIGIFVLGLCALPIALPLLLVVLCFIFTAVIFMLCMLFALVMVLIGVGISFFACIYQLIVTLGSDVFVTMFLLGMILASLGAGILIGLCVIWMVKKGFPALARGISRLYQKLRNRGEENEI